MPKKHLQGVIQLRRAHAEATSGSRVFSAVMDWTEQREFRTNQNTLQVSLMECLILTRSHFRQGTANVDLWSDACSAGLTRFVCVSLPRLAFHTAAQCRSKQLLVASARDYALGHSFP